MLLKYVIKRELIRASLAYNLLVTVLRVRRFFIR
jgi:hypothetical protein